MLAVTISSILFLLMFWILYGYHFAFILEVYFLVVDSLNSDSGRWLACIEFPVSLTDSSFNKLDSCLVFVFTCAFSVCCHAGFSRDKAVCCKNFAIFKTVVKDTSGRGDSSFPSLIGLPV